MKSAFFAVMVMVGCSWSETSGTGGDASIDAPDPHAAVQCHQGSATLCESACNPPPPGPTGVSCLAQTGYDSGTCDATFVDSDGKRGCCLQTYDLSGAYAIRFLECIP